MDGAQHPDPFSWDVGIVSEELSRPDRVWSRDPDRLRNNIEENEIDGKTLLTFEHVFSRQELMSCLEIKAARHKAALVEFIVDLSFRSAQYRQWYREWRRKQVNDLDISELPDTGPPLISQSQTQDLRPPAPTPSQDLNKSLPPENEDSLYHKGKDQKRLPAALSDHNATPSLLSDTVDTSVTRTQDERQPKRRRVAPVTLTAQPLGSAQTALPNEADVITFHESVQSPGKSQERKHHPFPWEDAEPTVYLGPGSLPPATLRSSDGSLSSKLLSGRDNDFATFVPNRIPCGRRLAVARTVRRMLVRNSRREALQRKGLNSSRDTTSPDEEDDILELDDLPEDFDEETRREIDAENLELEKQRDLEKQTVEVERISAILDESVQEMEAEWKERKLPKLERQAYALWQNANRRDEKTKKIFEARNEARIYEDRIAKLRQSILREKWTKESEVRQQARSMEGSVEYKMRQIWIIGMLESRKAPPMPQTLPKPRRRALPRSRANDDEEILTSSDEDDDFIVPDDDGTKLETPSPTVQRNRSLNRQRKGSPGLREDPDTYVDLTHVESPLLAWARRGEVIDLTTPTKSTKSANSSSKDALAHYASQLEGIEDVEGISKLSARHWADENDAFRMVISMLWKLSHTRRVLLFRVLRENTVDQAWQLLKGQLSDPLQDPASSGVDEMRLAAFDLTWIFYSFSRCKAYSEARMQKPKQRDDKHILQAKTESFPVFCKFMDGMEQHFPESSQIYRAEIPDPFEDDEFDDLSASGDQDPQKSTRKPAVKEIVQNKDAVDLRERERQRVEEQDARRMRLRKALEISGAVSHDQSRLIINESKQEDQSFIYVNETIGRMIKDHQIDGVRFLWNQIILDPKIRQGCLLAHSMGLGKTMQVISFLVAIMEATASADSALRSQIPEDLQSSQTLVLCPSGIVDNWMDELLLWAPEGCLGDLRKVDAQLSIEARLQTVKDWATGGGVLLMGYRVFTVVNKVKEMEELLLGTPNIVVADEAHHFKNPKAKLSGVCSQFRTKTRIAMTGTPLANHVEEYHSMIEWVAPNFLGPLAEFRDIYATPIQQGLWSDSSGYEKRRALKMLQALKEICEPKMDRKTVNSCLKQELLPKHEFVIAVAPTAMQQKLYDMYLGAIAHEDGLMGKVSQAMIFSIVNDLTLICNHPRCFRGKAEASKMNAFATEGESLPGDIAPAVLKETYSLDPIDPSLSRKVELLTLVLDESRLVGDKVLVFSQSIPTLDYLTTLLKLQKRRICRLDGRTLISKRQEMIKDFNTGEQEVYLISTNAGGVGLNIQGANRVVIFDFKWNPVHDQQAIGRAYRIGQTKPVFVYRFMVAGSFEESLHNRAVFKMQLASRVVDKKNPVSWSNRLGSLIHPIKPVPAADLSNFVGKDAILDKLVAFSGAEGAIRFIVSTDTFEEEDPTADLTAEDRKEASAMAKRNRLRATDPPAYQKLLEEERRAEIQRINGPDQRVRPQLAPPELQNIPSTSQTATTDVGSTMDGASDGPALSSIPPREMTVNFQAQVVMPLPARAGC